MLFCVLLDELTEDRNLRISKRLGQVISELLLARVVDLIDGRQLHLVQLRLGCTLNRAQQASLPRGDKEQRLAGAASAAGTTDAVDVGLGVVRNVVVDHVGNAVNVQATSSHIGCHQDVQAAVLELINRALTESLRDVAVDGSSGESAGTQLLGELLGLVLGAHEHDHRFEFLDFEDAGQRVQLVAVADHQEALANVVRSASLGLDGNLFRLRQVLLGQATNRSRHGSREQRDLLVIRGVGKNALDILLEAHLQHLIGLVQHQETQVGNVQRALLQVVDDTTRRADDNLRTSAQTRQLHSIGLTTVDWQDLNLAQVISKRLEGVRNLQRQLTGRSKHQSLRCADGAINASQNRQRKRRGLTGTSLSQADDVAAAHQSRDSSSLNWGRSLKPNLANCIDNVIRQLKLIEADGVVVVVFVLFGLLLGLFLDLSLFGLFLSGLLFDHRCFLGHYILGLHNCVLAVFALILAVFLDAAIHFIISHLGLFLGLFARTLNIQQLITHSWVAHT